MNRIALAPENIQEPVLSTGSPGILDARRDTLLGPLRKSGDTFATFAPIHYERGYAYPLLVWLHTNGGNECELRRIMPLVSMRNYVGVAPRGNLMDGRRRHAFAWRQTRDDIETAESRVAHCIAAAQQQFSIHAERVFLAGCGAGGTMALRIAWNSPARFAGVVAINGPLPTQLRPLWRVNELRRVPCLLATSRSNRNYAAEFVCRDLRLLHSAGCIVALRQYPGSDDLTSKMLADMDRWLMDLVCDVKNAS
jgi:phospholipase/carboxylesterase